MFQHHVTGCCTVTGIQDYKFGSRCGLVHVQRGDNVAGVAGIADLHSERGDNRIVGKLQGRVKGLAIIVFSCGIQRITEMIINVITARGLKV